VTVFRDNRPHYYRRDENSGTWVPIRYWTISLYGSRGSRLNRFGKVTCQKMNVRPFPRSYFPQQVINWWTQTLWLKHVLIVSVVFNILLKLRCVIEVLSGCVKIQVSIQCFRDWFCLYHKDLMLTPTPENGGGDPKTLDTDSVYTQLLWLHSIQIAVKALNHLNWSVFNYDHIFTVMWTVKEKCRVEVYFTYICCKWNEILFVQNVIHMVKMSTEILYIRILCIMHV
jgi:hypothetical protein